MTRERPEVHVPEVPGENLEERGEVGTDSCASPSLVFRDGHGEADAASPPVPYSGPAFVETGYELATLDRYATTSKLNPQSIATAVHNVGLQVGMALIQGETDALPVLCRLMEIIAHVDEEHLAREADEPLKLLVLRLLDAVHRGNRNETKSLLAALEAADKSVLDAAHERGWQLLTFFTIAMAIAALSG